MIPQAYVLALAAGVGSVVFTAFLMLLAGRMLRAPDTPDSEDALGLCDQ
jgi:hypothetical protein